MEIRIQKWMAQLGIVSRRQAEQWIQDGRIDVNGRRLNQLGFKLNPEKDIIKLDGRSLNTHLPPKIYWLLNKPLGVLCSRVAQGKKRTIFSLEKLRHCPFKLESVGRLDYLTEGLLLLTNDGDLANKLCHPRYHIPRHYQVLLSKRLSRLQLNQLQHGIMLEDGKTEGIEARFIHHELGQGQKGFWYGITVHEGRNRLIRRLFKKLNIDVQRLIRHGFGDVRLPSDLPPGQYRQLTGNEVKFLKQSTAQPTTRY